MEHAQVCWGMRCGNGMYGIPYKQTERKVPLMTVSRKGVLGMWSMRRCMACSDASEG